MLARTIDPTQTLNRLRARLANAKPDRLLRAEAALTESRNRTSAAREITSKIRKEVTAGNLNESALQKAADDERALELAERPARQELSEARRAAAPAIIEAADEATAAATEILLDLATQLRHVHEILATFDRSVMMAGLSEHIEPLSFGLPSPVDFERVARRANRRAFDAAKRG